MRGWGYLRVLFLVVLLTDDVRADVLVGNFAGFSSGTIRRYRESDGAFLGPAGQSAAETSQGMTLGPDGLLYVAGNNLGSGYIARNNPVTGQFLGYFVDPVVQPGAAPYQMPNDLSFGTDGFLYSTSEQFLPNGVTGVVRFNGTTAAFGGVVIPPGNNGLGRPSSVVHMPGGDLLVSDAQRVNRYDGTTLAFESTFITPGSGGVGSLFEFTFGPDGNFYSSDTANDRVVRFDGSTGAFLGTFASVDSPFGLTFGNDGHLYVVASVGGARRVGRFNGTTGQPMGTAVPAGLEIDSAFYLLTAPDIPEPASIAIAMLLSSAALVRRCRPLGGSARGPANARSSLIPSPPTSRSLR
jgi:sugar lactone lactonase YvrE